MGKTKKEVVRTDLLVVKHSRTVEEALPSLKDLASMLGKDVNVHLHILLEDTRGSQELEDHVDALTTYTPDDVLTHLRGFGLEADFTMIFGNYPSIYFLVLCHWLRYQKFGYALILADHISIGGDTGDVVALLKEETPFCMVDLFNPFSDKGLMYKLFHLFDQDLTKFYLQENNFGYGLTSAFMGCDLSIFDKFMDEITLKLLLQSFDCTGVDVDILLAENRQPWDMMVQANQIQSFFCIMSCVFSDLTILDPSIYSIESEESPIHAKHFEAV